MHRRPIIVAVAALVTILLFDAARLATHRAAQAEHAARVAGIAGRADGGDRLRFRVQ